MTITDRACRHPAHLLVGNPYRCAWTGGVDKVWVIDCRCGAVVVLSEPTVRQAFGLTTTIRKRREALLRAGGLYVGQHLTDHGGDVLHGGARGRGRSDVDMPQDTSTQPAESPNAAANS